jgi:hypothetical protein
MGRTPRKGPAGTVSLFVMYMGTLRPCSIWRTGTPADSRASSKLKEHPSRKATKSSCEGGRHTQVCVRSPSKSHPFPPLACSIPLRTAHCRRLWQAREWKHLPNVHNVRHSRRQHAVPVHIVPRQVPPQVHVALGQLTGRNRSWPCLLLQEPATPQQVYARLRSPWWQRRVHDGCWGPRRRGWGQGLGRV